MAQLAEARKLVNEMQKMHDKAKIESRGFTPDEQETFDKLENRYNELMDQPTDDISLIPEGRNKLNTQERWVDSEGKEVRVLNPNEKLSRSEDMQGWGDFDLSKAIRALATGDYSHAKNELRAMDLSGSTAMVPTPISNEIIDLARNNMVLNKLGTKTVPMTSSTLRFARITSDPTAVWKVENNAYSNSAVGLDAVTLTAKLITSGVNLSQELAEDAPNASQMVQQTLAKTLAHAIDAAGLVGSGSGQEPQGIYGYTNVTDTGTIGTPSYDDFSSQYFRITENNEMPNGLVVAPRTLLTLDQLKDSQGRYLEPPESWKKFTTLSTNAIPTNLGTGTDESIGIMGDFSQLFYGVRTGLKVEVSRQAAGGSESAWLNLQVWIRIYARIDFAIARPAAFQTVSGITV